MTFQMDGCLLALGGFFLGHFSWKAEGAFKMGWVSFSSLRLSTTLRGSERLDFGIMEK